jgi:predicted nucleic acid-binding protein
MRAGSYLDTSFMLKFYLLEPDSEEAVVWLLENRNVVFVSPLTDVEVITAFSREDSEGAARRAIDNYLDDLAANVYVKLQIDAEVFTLAAEIAERYARQYKLRSLDVLHLAIALRHSVLNFGTYDKRLGEAAAGMGLRVLPERS